MIREARSDDVAAIAGLEAAAFGRAAWSARLVADSVGSPRHAVLVDLADDGRLLGYGSISVAGDFADLDRIAVAPSARREGRGAALLAALIRAAADRDCVRILLEVAEGNAAAQELYRAAGFVAISRREAYNPDGSASLVLQRPLGG